MLNKLESNNWTLYYYDDPTEQLDGERTPAFNDTFEMSPAIFESCPFKNYILGETQEEIDNVYFIIVGGSFADKIYDKKSDYDFIVVTKSPYRYKTHKNIWLEYNGRHVHWYYIDLLNFLTPKFSESCFGIYKRFFLTAESFIYVSSEANIIKERFLANKDILFRAGVGLYYNYMKILLNKAKNITNKQDLLKISYAKHLYCAIEIAHILLGTLETLNKDYCLQTKRILDSEISNEAFNYLITEINNAIPVILDFLNIRDNYFDYLESAWKKLW